MLVTLQRRCARQPARSARRKSGNTENNRFWFLLLSLMCSPLASTTSCCCCCCCCYCSYDFLLFCLFALRKVNNKVSEVSYLLGHVSFVRTNGTNTCFFFFRCCVSPTNFVIMTIVSYSLVYCFTYAYERWRGDNFVGVNCRRVNLRCSSVGIPRYCF